MNAQVNSGKQPALDAAQAGKTANPAQTRLKKRTDGAYYVENEVKVCLTDGFAKSISFKNNLRAAADSAGIGALHTGIHDVRGGHTSADAWLQGRAFPQRLRAAEGSIPESARCITLLLKAGVDAEEVVAALRKNPNIVWAELNVLAETNAAPNDTEYENQWAPARMGLEDAWDIPQRATGIRIAIVDSGVDLEHPDLNITYNRGFGGNTSGDAMNTSPDPRGEPSRQHGTHVAGIAAAIRNNNQGIAGVADAELMAMGCASWNAAANAWFIGSTVDAVRDAVDNGADIINCSFACPTVGGFGTDQNDMSAGMRSAVDHALNNGVLVVAAAGNTIPNGVDISNTRWTSHPWVIVVTNTQNDANDPLAASSDFGQGVDLAAPGTGIRSTFVFSNDGIAANDYGTLSGTSMASPQVAGGAARVWSLNPNLLNSAAVKHILTRMARFYADRGAAGVDDQYGAGRLSFSREFHSPIREATAFVSPDFYFFPNGTYSIPYSGLNAIPNAGTLVLNGGTADLGSYVYTATRITKPCTLKALPDQPVRIQHP